MRPDEGDALALDRMLWQAAMDRRIDDFRAMMAPEYVGVYARGFVTADDDAAVTATMEIASFRFEDGRTSQLSPDLLLTTYITVLDATVGGVRDISGRYASTSVWRTADASGAAALLYHAESRIP